MAVDISVNKKLMNISTQTLHTMITKKVTNQQIVIPKEL